MKQFLTLFLSFLVIATSSMMAQTKDENKPEMKNEKREGYQRSFLEDVCIITRKSKNNL